MGDKQDKSTSYVYTYQNKHLTESQRQFYEENGFLVIKKLIPLEDLEIYRQRFIDICNKKVIIPIATIMKDVAYAKNPDMPIEEAVNKVQDFQSDKVMYEFVKHPEILKYVNDIVGDNTMAIHSMLINKPPDQGTNTSRHPMHQDLHYFPIRPANRIVAAWTAMEKINRDNGCLAVVKGTHKKPLATHDYPEWKDGVNRMYHGLTEYKPEEEDRVYLDMDPGDTVFFHPCLFHGSGANKTKGFRKAISCHYAAGECEYIETKGTTQEKIAEEVLAQAKKKVEKIYDEDELNKFTYVDVWKLKSRLASGERLNI